MESKLKKILLLPHRVNSIIRNQKRLANIKNHSGFTLVEVVVATMILAMCGATIASIQYTSYSNAAISIERVKINLLVRSILSIVIANKTQNGIFEGEGLKILEQLTEIPPPMESDYQGVNVSLNISDYSSPQFSIDILKKISITIDSSYVRETFDYYMIK